MSINPQCTTFMGSTCIPIHEQAVWAKSWGPLYLLAAPYPPSLNSAMRPQRNPTLQVDYRSIAAPPKAGPLPH